MKPAAVVSSRVCIGDALSKSWTVELSQTTNRFNLPGGDILSTPNLVYMLEKASSDLLEDRIPLDDGFASVGFIVNIAHMAPSPLGSKVNVTTAVESIDGRKINFAVLATDEQGTVLGKGHHVRAVIPAPKV
jgi:predicted thioesterase